MQRQPISKKDKFEILKRDLFTCQYCGKKSPDVILEIDHVIPVSKGGTNDLSNLVAACFDCNRGKSDRQLSDSSIIEKQRIQLENDQERINQIEMFAEWRLSLLDTYDLSVDKISEYFYKITDGICFTESGKETMKKHIKKYGLELCYNAIDIIKEQYKSNYATGLQKIEGILHNLKKEIEIPNYREITKLCHDARYYVSNYFFKTIESLLIHYMNCGISLNDLSYIIKSKKHYNTEELQNNIEDFINGSK